MQGTDWGEWPITHFLDFPPILNYSQNVNHSPSSTTSPSPFKSNLPGSKVIQRTVDLRGEEDSLLFYT